MGSLADSLVKPGIFSIVQGISGTGIRRTEDGVWIEIFSSTLSFKKYRDN